MASYSNDSGNTKSSWAINFGQSSTATFVTSSLTSDRTFTLPDAAGTISIGTVATGGTGQTSYTDGQLLIGNTSGNTLTKATITGTASQVVVTNGNGSITLSTPQNIATTSTPQFANIGVGQAASATAGQILTFTGTATCYGTNSVGNLNPSADSVATVYGGIYAAYLKADFNYTSNGGAAIGLQGTGALFGVTSQTVTRIIGIAGVVQHISGSNGTSSNGEAIYAASPVVTSGTMTNAHGLYIAKQKQTNVTNGYGVYQVDSGDLNFFAGQVLLATTMVPSGSTSNFVLGGGSTSPVLGAATADIVSTAAVDAAAGDRRWYIQAESGSSISLGKDRLNYAASTGLISIAGTDLLSMTTTTFTVSSTTDSTSSSTGASICSGGLVTTKNHLSLQGQGWGVTSTATATTTTTLTTSSKTVQVFTGATTQSVTLPAANAFGSGIAVVFVIKNRSSGTVTINRAGSDTIDGGTSTTLTGGSNQSVTLISDGSSAWEIC